MEDQNNTKSNLVENSKLSIDVEPFVPKNFSKSSADVLSYQPSFYPQLYAPFGVAYTDFYSNIGFEDYSQYYANPFPSSPSVYQQPELTTTSPQPDFYKISQPTLHTYQPNTAKPSKKLFSKESQNNISAKDKNRYDKDTTKEFSRNHEAQPPSRKHPVRKIEQTKRTFRKPKLNSLEEFPTLPNFHSDNIPTSPYNSSLSSNASYSSKLKEVKPPQNSPKIAVAPDPPKDKKNRNSHRKHHSLINEHEGNFDKSKPLKELNGKNLKKENDSLILNNTYAGKNPAFPNDLSTERKTEKKCDVSRIEPSASHLQNSYWNKDNCAFLKENRETHGKNIYKDGPDTKYSSKTFNKQVNKSNKSEPNSKLTPHLKVEKAKYKNNIEKQNQSKDSSKSQSVNKSNQNNKQNSLQNKNLVHSTAETKFKKEFSKWEDSTNTFVDSNFSKKPCNKNHANLKSLLDSPKKCTKETLKVVLNSKVDLLRKGQPLSTKLELTKPLNVKKDANPDIPSFVPPSLPLKDPNEYPELGAASAPKPSRFAGNAGTITPPRLIKQLPSSNEASSTINHSPLSCAVVQHPLGDKEEKKGENEKADGKVSSKSSRTSLELDFTNLLRMVSPKSQQKKKKEPRLLVKKQVPIKRPANILDSSAPLTKKGKERLTPKRKKPSPLKKIILLEKEEKKRLREQIRQQLEISDVILEGEQEGLCPEPPSPEELLQDSLIQRVLSDTVTRHQAAKVILHTRKFRDYCCHLPSSDIDKIVQALLTDLLRFQDRAFQKDPVKAKTKRRVVYGLREITKHLKLHKLKAIIFATDIEKIDSQGGLTDNLTFIQALAREQGVQCVYALKRSTLGHICSKKVPISCIGIFNYEGADKHFRNLIEMAHHQEEAYRNELARIESLLTDELLHDFQNQALHSLQFNQWVNRTRLLLLQPNHQQDNKSFLSQGNCQESVVSIG